MEEFGVLLRRLRGVRPRQKAAEAMGITVEALQAYEEGRRMPRDEVIFRAARYYGVSASQLLRARSAGRAMPADKTCGPSGG